MNTVTPTSPPLRIDWAVPQDRPAHGDSAVRPAAARAGRVTVRPRTGLTSAASWAELTYAVVGFAPAVFFFAALVTLLTAGAGLVIIYVGIPVIMAALLLARFGGALQVGMARSLLGMPVMLPGAFHRRSRGISGLVGSVLRDAAAWRAVLYFGIKIALAPVTFAVAVAGYGWGIGAVSYPIWRSYLPAVQAGDGSWHRGAQLWNDFFIDTWLRMGVYAAVGLLVLLAAPHVLRWFVTADRLLIRALLARR